MRWGCVLGHLGARDWWGSVIGSVHLKIEEGVRNGERRGAMGV